MATQGYCEALRRGPRFLAVNGWAEAAAFVPGTRLIVRAGDVLVASAAIGRGEARDDLVSLDAAAFAVVMPAITPIGVALDVILSAGGIEQRLRRFEPTEILDAEPRGHVDSVDGTRLRGWVVDPAAWLLGTPPRLLVGTLAIDLPLNEERLDLGTEVPTGTLLGFNYTWSWIVAQVRGLDPDFVLGGTTPLAIEASGVEVARLRHHHAPRTRGRLERRQAGTLLGWGVDSARAQEALPVDLLIDGIRYDSDYASLERGDLRAKGIALAGGGFRFDLPTRMPGDAAEANVGIRAGLTSTLLETGNLKTVTAVPRMRSHAGILQTLPAADGLGITIIVPIFRAAEDVGRCIEALTRNTSFPARLLLIDDASDDPAIDVVLANAATLPNVSVVVHPVNRGFTATCNHGISLAGQDDVVLLNSDTMVTPGWLEGLRIAAYSEAGVATVTPLSDNAGAFSVPEHNAANRGPIGFDHDDTARLIRHASRALMPAMPTGNGFCLYIRRDALDRIGPLDEAAFPRGYGEENDLCMRAWRAGLTNLVDDRSYVHHRRSVSFGVEKSRNIAAGRAVVHERYPEYRLLTRQLRDDPDMLAIRWRVRRAVAQAKAPPRPRVLYVISTTSGGTPQTNADLMAALADRYEPWVLRCYSRSLELSRWSENGIEQVETRELERPVQAAVHRSNEYDGSVADLLIRYGFELVHIRHIAWHGLGLPEVCRRLAIPVVFSFHDFYTVCPTTKLLDENKVFCGGRCTPGAGACQPELWQAQMLPTLKHRFVYRWREMMTPMIEACDAFVTTSPGAKETMLANYPQLASRDFRVIPHARDFEHMDRLAALPGGAEKLRVLVPGNISVAKGAELIAAVAELDAMQEVEFHILGDPGRVPAGPGVIHHGRYARDGFADAVRRIRPHVGAILSIWPETYSHTLTEMWAAGLPVVALDTGAVGERIAEVGGGWLLDPASSPASVLEAVRAIRRDRGDQRARIEQVADWQSGLGRVYDTAAMAARYDKLYRDTLRRRLVFAPALDVQPMVVLVHADASESGLHASLARRARNAVSRQIIFRQAGRDFAWEDVALGEVDAVLVAISAVALHQLPALIAGGTDKKVPLIVDMGDFRGDRLSAAHWALLEQARLVLVPDATVAAGLMARGILADVLGRKIEAGRWRGSASRYRPEPDTTPRFLVVGSEKADAVQALAASSSGQWVQGDETVLVNGTERHDLIVIAEANLEAARRYATLCEVAGLPFVDMADADAAERLAVLTTDPLARDKAALAAWRALDADAWLPRQGDALDKVLLELGNAPEAAFVLDEAA